MFATPHETRAIAAKSPALSLLELALLEAGFFLPFFKASYPELPAAITVGV